MKRSPIRRVSRKRAAKHASPEGKADLAYMQAVKMLPCFVCYAPGPNDAHHCQDRPEAEASPYQQEPCAGRKSGARDTIPLCKACHQSGPDAYHNGKAAWRERNGPDYGFIEATRALVRARNGL